MHLLPFFHPSELSLSSPTGAFRKQIPSTGSFKSQETSQIITLLYVCVQDWLGRYGYLPPPDLRTGKLHTKEGIEHAIRVMQRFGGLQETGVLGTVLLTWTLRENRTVTRRLSFEHPLFQTARPSGSCRHHDALCLILLGVRTC